MEAERKSREAEHLKRALVHLIQMYEYYDELCNFFTEFFLLAVESYRSKLSQEKIDEIIQLDGMTSGELLNSKILVFDRSFYC